MVGVVRDSDGGRGRGAAKTRNMLNNFPLSSGPFGKIGCRSHYEYRTKLRNISPSSQYIQIKVTRGTERGSGWQNPPHSLWLSINKAQ